MFVFFAFDAISLTYFQMTPAKKKQTQMMMTN